MSVRAGPEPDLRNEAIRVLDAADAAGLVVRAVGGLGVWLTCPSASRPPLARQYKDLDLVAGTGASAGVQELLMGLGYEPDRSFNQVHGHQRLYFWDTSNARQLDVFVGRMAMCHELELDGRLGRHPRALAPADLLLTKLQVVHPTERDLVDAAALLLDHRVAEDGIEPERVAEVLAGDWGWWRTSTATLGAVVAHASGLPGFERAEEVVTERAAALGEVIEEAPKSMRWRLRAKVGDRVRWYEVPEEIEAEQRA